MYVSQTYIYFFFIENLRNFIKEKNGTKIRGTYPKQNSQKTHKQKMSTQTLENKLRKCHNKNLKEKDKMNT